MLPSFAVDAVLLPRVTGATETRVEPASPADCMTALAPTSVLSIPGARAAEFAALARVARAVPAHHLLLGTDVRAIPGVVERFLGGRA
jgi:hypothetical protein